jgi:hypothetical protein
VDELLEVAFGRVMIGGSILLLKGNSVAPGSVAGATSIGIDIANINDLNFSGVV